MQFALFSRHSTPSHGDRICRLRVQSGLVWIQTRTLAPEPRFPLRTSKPRVSDCLHSVYRRVIYVSAASVWARIKAIMIIQWPNPNPPQKTCEMIHSHSVKSCKFIPIFFSSAKHDIFPLRCLCVNKQILFALQTSATSVRWRQVCMRETYARGRIENKCLDGEQWLDCTGFVKLAGYCFSCLSLT